MNGKNSKLWHATASDYALPRTAGLKSSNAESKTADDLKSECDVTSVCSGTQL